MVGGIENEGEPMPRTRKGHAPGLKAKVAVEAIKGHKRTAQIAQMFGVHATQVGGWKKQAPAGLRDVFGNATRPRPIAFSGKLYGIRAEARVTQCYCSLSNSAGSMCRARFTGPATESRPVSAMVNITAPSTNGSCAEAW
jgi:transposase-like protein